MKHPAPKRRDPRGGINLHSLGGKDRLGTNALNSASFGQGVTLADIENLTLSAADIAYLAPPPTAFQSVGTFAPATAPGHKLSFLQIDVLRCEFCKPGFQAQRAA